jgi:glutamine amidotransferase
MENNDVITIIDYGAGNIGSIVNMISRMGGKSIISSSIEDLLNAKKIILPGVGSFDFGMQKLLETGYIETLEKKVLEEKVPILGICLGAQMMCKNSDEGNLQGLGWFDANVKKFEFENKNELRIPHMGWNYIQNKKDNLITEGLAEKSKFYFVHSYYISSNNQSEILLETNYGLPFVSALQKENIYAVQFHPEKSHKFGMQLFKNFIAI